VKGLGVGWGKVRVVGGLGKVAGKDWEEVEVRGDSEGES